MEYEKYVECVDVVCLHCTELSEETCQKCPVRITYKKLGKYTKEVNAEFYPMDIPYDKVFQIVNENDTPIGLVFISNLVDGIYIEWIEILTVFRGKGYLRKVFENFKAMGNKIHLECSDELLPKYLNIGCILNGTDECTELNILTYE